MSTPLNGSLIKAFEILALFDEDRPEASAATVARQLDLNASTAHRFLLTLEHVGALTSVRRGVFGLGPRLEQLGRLAERMNPLPAFVKPLLDDLSREMAESVMVCRLSRLGPVCVAVAESGRPVSVVVKTGTALPFRHTAQGKLWLAFMPEEERSALLQQTAILNGQAPESSDMEKLARELNEIRERGYALNLGDNEPDIAAVAVPVRSGTGEMIMSLSVFGMLSRFDKTFTDRARRRLLEVSDEIGGNFVSKYGKYNAR
ncbi:IclR family transcriptional regulator [Roseibium aggregatum]|uniref:IclR family transcriptional regulator n=1 Tax=Roseibium aggregatum TaxID=187304 RepID=A0A939J7F6_9HYPH|nr:IclR family transcriptional regulator [Roseibium aggregatum]MBN9673784.1 IclR family transcriptional regulator [Roseibium aggregatum]